MAATKDYDEDEQYDEGEYDEEEIAEPHDYVPPSAQQRHTHSTRSPTADRTAAQHNQQSRHLRPPLHSTPTLAYRHSQPH